MDYKKPDRKRKANEDYLKSIGLSKDGNPYLEEETEQKKLFLIVCEGKNTEPRYFEAFPVPTNTVITEGGRGSKTALVDYTLSIRGKYPGREIWCVFDFDYHPDEATTQPEDFNNAIKKAVANELKVAWSNDAFELWFVLHYQRIENALTRKEINQILKEKWELQSFDKESKRDEFCKGHYRRHGGTLSKMQHHAIKNARELHQSYGGRENFAHQIPCTTVYLLVVELNKNLKA